MSPTKKSESMKNKANMWNAASGNTEAKKQKQLGSSEKEQPATQKKNQAKGGKSMNSKTEFAQDMCALDDQEIVADVLKTHKSLVTLYGTALCETSCENLRTLIGEKITECAEDQFDVFLYMNERNLYPTEEATMQKLTQAKDRFKKIENQMKK